MSRPPDPRRTQLIGLVVAVVTGGGIASMYAYATGDPWRGDMAMIDAHFVSVSGLKKGSDVLVSGKPVGRVDNVAFVTTTYECDPATEDIGRDASDACEPWLFCAEMPDGGGLCASLIPFTGVAADYADNTCIVDQLCKDSEICFSPFFRQRHPDVAWYGPENTCVPFQVDHQRVEVRMAIQVDKLAFISKDSKASVASKGALGDQQINIDSGSAESIEPGGHLQSKKTLMEELNDFRERIGVVTGRFSGNLESFRALQGTVKSGPDDRPPRDMRTTLARVSASTRDIATHQGNVGELFESDAREDAITSLQDLRASSDEVRRDIINWRRKNTPRIREVGKDMGEFAESAHAAADPNDDGMGSKLLTDERFGIDIAGRVSDVSDTIGSARNSLGDVHQSVLDMRRDVENAEGPLGELVRDPDLYYSFVKAIAMFDLFDRNDAVKSLVRSVIAAGDDYEGNDDRDRARARPATPSRPETSPENSKSGSPPPPPPPPASAGSRPPPPPPPAVDE
jgi:hypothetical protein